MLPVFKATASSPVLPSARKPSWNDGPNPILDSLPTFEAEANPRVAELDAEGHGPHVLEMDSMVPVSEMEAVVPASEMDTVEHTSEMETSERALEFESQRPVAELEGITMRW